MSALVIGLDYGTTYTGVAFAAPKGGQSFSLEDIELVDVWGDRMDNHDKVPSVISFSAPSRAGEQQWGSDLSADAIAMVHTKLELDLQEVQGELDLMLHALQGMKDLHFDELKKVGALPAYTDQTAEQIVTVYLSRVFEFVSETISDFSRALLDRIPVVIVITVPTVSHSHPIQSITVSFS
jgi:molecular chaperone DnaK (HSP70)